MSAIRSRTQARSYLNKALRRGSESGQTYDLRSYQVSAAWKCVEALRTRHAVLTLPTGTGKTLICGMVAALFMTERSDQRVIITAPRRMLLVQLAERSRWLNPTAKTQAVGIDRRENDQHVRAAVHHTEVVFGMPQFLARRLRNPYVVPKALVKRISLVIVDEFDAFLTVRYLARCVRVEFHSALGILLELLPANCRLLLVSATTPEPLSSGESAEPDERIDSAYQTAYRRYLDETFNPAYISIQERYYRDYIPHAEIHAVSVSDGEVLEFDQVIADEFSLLANWISGNLHMHIDLSYVLPRLGGILAGKLAVMPGGPRVRASSYKRVRALLGRLQLISHISDFLFEDMFKGFRREYETTFKFAENLYDKMPIGTWRLREPTRVRKKNKDQIEMHPRLRGKFGATKSILARYPSQKGVLFFRYIRILEEVNRALAKLGYRTLIVHGNKNQQDNDDALRRFRSSENVLLLITRDTGKRGLDLPEADFAVFYSPKSREDVTWQEVSRIRSTIRNQKTTYMLYYEHTAEEKKARSMIEALSQTTHSKRIRFCSAVDLGPC